MPFNPDQFLAEPEAAPVIAQEQQSSGIPEQIQPKQDSFDPDQFLASENQDQYGSAGQQLATFGEAAARGAVSSPIASAAEVSLGVPREGILGREKANPWTNFFGELTGFAVPLIATAGMSAEARGAFAAGEIGAEAARGTSATAKLASNLTLPGLLSKVGNGAAELAGTGKVGSAVIKGLIDGLVISGSDEVGKTILQDPDQTAGSVVAHVGLGTLLSGSLGTVGGLWHAARSDGVDALLNVIKSDSEGVGSSLAPKPGDLRVNNFMKNALNVALGPSTEHIDARVANLEAIRNAPEFQDVYDHVLDHIQSVGDDVAAQKDILNIAQKEFEKSGYEASLANQAAKTVLKDAQTQVIQDITQNAYSKAPAISNAVDVLNNQAIEDSQAARDLLNKTNRQIPLKNFYNKIKELQDKVFSQGSPLALQQAENLGKYAEAVGAQYGIKADAPMVKNIIGGLDQLSKWNANAVEGGLAPYYRQIRYTLDQTLKDIVPKYAEAIKPSSEKFKLLDRLSKYATPEDAIKSISALKRDTNYINEIPLLRELQERSGIKFTQDLDQYASPALRRLKISKLPEYAEAERAANALAYYRHPETYAALEHTIMTDPEWLQAMESKNNIKGITEINLQGKLNSAMEGKNISSRSLMEKLPGLKGMSIPEILDLIAVRNAFSKGAGMGARNVNLFGGIGGTFGGVLGGAIGGLPGASIGAGIGGSAGAMLGGVIDRKGPTIAAGLLDKYVSSFGSLPEKSGLSDRIVRATLKSILGSEAVPSATGFKAAADYTEAATKGIKATNNAARNLFIKGIDVIPKNLIPEKDTIKDLDDTLKDVKKNPVQHLAFGGEVGHYMPNHVEALAKVGATAVDTLNALRPSMPQNAPLDKQLEPSDAAKYSYNKILEVAQQPLMLLHHLKQGTLLAQHIGVVKSLYPKYFEQMNQEVTNAMVDHLNDGKKIPYHIKNGLSMLLGQPLISSQQPQNIQSIIRSAMPQQQPQQEAKKGSNKASGAELSQINKVNALYLTDLQERSAANRSK